MSATADVKPVLILGAGVNGCAVARELVLNNVPVVLVDTADIGMGATAKSSRLIHGGLRYLEYADFRLVAESLRERELQLKLAPQFVRPLKLHIPVRRRLGGLVQSACRFLGLTRFGLGRALSDLAAFPERGLYTVRLGLWAYDLLARSSRLPGHSVHRVGAPQAPRVDPQQYRWVCSYYDAQMLYPERFVIALLQDARKHADEHGGNFRILPYHRVEWDGRTARVRRLDRDGILLEPPVASFEPCVIINATGAWGDLTLKALGMERERLFGGTKGSHIITQHPGLREAIGEDGIYAESQDGRLVFILPFGTGTLIGTTDLRFDGPPQEAIATEEEIAYLLEMVNDFVPHLGLARKDVAAHYCGVRPLPYVPSGRTGAIPRGHAVHTSHLAGISLHTLIGGKLTTWRAFGEEVAHLVMSQLGLPGSLQTRERIIPGAIDAGESPEEWIRGMAAQTRHSQAAARFLFDLMGASAAGVLERCEPGEPTLPGLPVTGEMVDQVIRTEWVTRLADLVERRLALVFDGQLSHETLAALADRLVRTGHLLPQERERELADCCGTLQRNYGVSIPAVHSL
jgi:glycerol-3-phosphate dehydrogenase